MTVITPSAKVASRWNGALEARLRHAPLETFIRARGRRWVVAGEARVTDNLAAATMYFIDAGLAEIAPVSVTAHDPVQQVTMGHVACAVSHGLAGVIREPGAWRIAALVATARLLAPLLGLDAAARVAASTAREYNGSLAGGADVGLLRLSAAAAGAVQGNDDPAFTACARLIAARFCANDTRMPLRAQPSQR